MIKPPSKQTCLYLAKHYSNYDTKTAKKLMWMYIFCYEWYDHWVEDWINAKD